MSHANGICAARCMAQLAAMCAGRISRTQAVCPGSNSEGVFFLRWGTILAGSGFSGTPLGPNCSRCMSSHLFDPLLEKPGALDVRSIEASPLGTFERLDSRDQTENYCQDNSTQETGDENGATAGRVENDFTASSLLRWVRLLRRWGGLGWAFSHHEIPPHVKAQCPQSFRRLVPKTASEAKRKASCRHSEKTRLPKEQELGNPICSFVVFIPGTRQRPANGPGVPRWDRHFQGATQSGSLGWNSFFAGRLCSCADGPGNVRALWQK